MTISTQLATMIHEKKLGGIYSFTKNYLHCFDLKPSESRRFTNSFSSLFELTVGLTAFGFPYTTQGSLPEKEPPTHQHPGVN